MLAYITMTNAKQFSISSFIPKHQTQSAHESCSCHRCLGFLQAYWNSRQVEIRIFHRHLLRMVRKVSGSLGYDTYAPYFPCFFFDSRLLHIVCFPSLTWVTTQTQYTPTCVSLLVQPLAIILGYSPRPVCGLRSFSLSVR